VTLISPWQAWYNNRHGSTYKFYEVFGSGITVSRSGIMDSVFLIFLITAILAVAGVLIRSRALVLLSGVIALGFTILWMVRQGQAAGELTITGANNRGLGSGVAWAFGGSLLMIIGSLLMPGRPERVAAAEHTTAQAPAVGTAGAMGAGAAGAVAVSEPPTITTTAPADKNRPAQVVPAPDASPTPAEPEPAPTAETTSASAAERTGTERLSKEERQMLGLDEEASTQNPPKSQN
jgi:hypothetical protein